MDRDDSQKKVKKNNSLFYNPIGLGVTDINHNSQLPEIIWIRREDELTVFH